MALKSFFGAIGPRIAMSDTESHSSSSSSAHTLTLTLNTDGTFDVDDSVNGSVATGNWLWPPGAASSDYAVTATFVSEDPGLGGGGTYTGTFGSSLNLGTARSWSQTVGSDPDDPRNVVFDLDFTWNGGAKGHTVRVTLTVS
jgi:hypothetical protein